MARLEPSCGAARLEKMQIYMSDVVSEPTQEDFLNHYELIPLQAWAGSLRQCGLKEGYVLYFTTRNLTLKKGGLMSQQKRESSHPRQAPAQNPASPKLPSILGATSALKDDKALK